MERGVQRNPRVYHRREAGCLLIVGRRKGTAVFKQDICLRIIRQGRGTAAHGSVKVCGNCRPCFTLSLSLPSALCKEHLVMRRLLGRMSVGGGGGQMSFNIDSSFLKKKVSQSLRAEKEGSRKWEKNLKMRWPLVWWAQRCLTVRS